MSFYMKAMAVNAYMDFDKFVSTVISNTQVSFKWFNMLLTSNWFFFLDLVFLTQGGSDGIMPSHCTITPENPDCTYQKKTQNIINFSLFLSGCTPLDPTRWPIHFDLVAHCAQKQNKPNRKKT